MQINAVTAGLLFCMATILDWVMLSSTAVAQECTFSVTDVVFDTLDMVGGTSTDAIRGSISIASGTYTDTLGVTLTY